MEAKVGKESEERPGPRPTTLGHGPVHVEVTAKDDPIAIDRVEQWHEVGDDAEDVRRGTPVEQVVEALTTVIGVRSGRWTRATATEPGNVAAGRCRHRPPATDQISSTSTPSRRATMAEPHGRRPAISR